MSLSSVRENFEECPRCWVAKPWIHALCRECIERRELFGVLEALRRMPTLLLLPKVRRLITICPTCNGTPDPECKEHGR